MLAKTWLFFLKGYLTLFIPSSSESVAFPGPSNIGATRSKVGLGQDKPDRNAHISTVNIAVLPSLADTVSLPSLPVYSELNTHLSLESTTLSLQSSAMKSIYIQCFRKLIFLWLAIIFSQIWMSKQCHRKWEGFLPSSEGSLFWKWFQFGCVFQYKKSRVHWTRASFWGRCEHNHEEREPSSAVQNVLSEICQTSVSNLQWALHCYA